MEKGFRTFQCHGCFVKLRFTVSEKDYGTTKTIRCPKCKAGARLGISYPAPATSKTKAQPSPSNTNPFSWDFPGREIFDALFKSNKK